MRKASSWKEMAALEKCSEETYQFQELYVLPLSSTLSAADAPAGRPFAQLLKVSWVLSGSSWSTKMDSVRVSNTLIRENYSLVYFTNIFPVSTHLLKPQKHYSTDRVKKRVAFQRCTHSRFGDPRHSDSSVCVFVAVVPSASESGPMSIGEAEVGLDLARGLVFRNQ